MTVELCYNAHSPLCHNLWSYRLPVHVHHHWVHQLQQALLPHACITRATARELNHSHSLAHTKSCHIEILTIARANSTLHTITCRMKFATMLQVRLTSLSH